MTPSQQLSRARNCVHAYCQEQFPEETIELHDSIFINKGFYRGRRFRCHQVSAVWFAEEDQLKIHAPDGTCVANWDASEMAKRATRPEQIEAADAERPSTLPMIAPDSYPQVEIRRAA